MHNYIKIAYRNLVKHRFISFINLFGLTIGLCCCLVILAYILNELSYDRSPENAADIYRVERTFSNPETGAVNLNLAAIAPPAGPLLQNDFKEIKTVTQLLQNGSVPIKYADKIFNEPNSFFADEHFLQLFSVPVLRGNPATALADPNCVMMTEEVAKKYFGNEDPLNKVVRLNNQLNLKVTGIFTPLPQATHLHPEVLISFNTLKDSAVYGEKQLQTNWGNNAFFTYVLLPPGYNPARLERQFPAFVNRYIESDEHHKASSWTSLSLRNLKDIHLYSHRDDEAEENGDITRVYIFAAIALFILLIACINYMNLSTARSVLRGKEIGIRKVAGARKGELITQFLAELVLVCWLATLLSFVLVMVLLPWINKVSAQHLSLQVLLHWQVLVPLIAVPFVVGILSGLYPAFYLSSFQPIKVLKGITKIGNSNMSLRKALVVVQFSISIVLIIGTAVVFQQLKYMQTASLGFSKDQVLTLNNNPGLTENYEAFKTQLLSNPTIQNITRSSRIPSGRLLDAMGSQIDRGNSLTPVQAAIKFVVADEDFMPTYQVHLLAGRNFSKSFGTDTAAFLLNEAAVKVLGLASNEKAVGRRFQYGGRKGQIVGIFNDFHFESMHQRILPLVLLMPKDQNDYGRISIKIAGNNVQAAIGNVEKVWRKFLPEIPFEYSFLDQRFQQLYSSEQRQGALFTIFACIAIFIACLGLFGLSAFTITQRIKEIGIRKVLGASANNIVTLISRDFLQLVGVAAIIAFPVAWLAMHRWLQDFAYRVEISAWLFIAAAVLAALVAFVTIGLQALKAAMTNPVKNLRTE